MRQIPRPALGGSAAAAASPPSLTAACGGDRRPRAGRRGKVTLRFTWWGSDTRHKRPRGDRRVPEGPTRTSRSRASSGSGPATGTSSPPRSRPNDAPDIIQMDEKYLREYADRGALLDLKTPDGSATADFEPDALGAGEFDGEPVRAERGVNAYSILVATRPLFKAAGVDDARRHQVDLGRLRPICRGDHREMPASAFGLPAIRQRRGRPVAVGQAARRVPVHGGRKARLLARRPSTSW